MSRHSSRRVTSSITSSLLLLYISLVGKFRGDFERVALEYPFFVSMTAFFGCNRLDFTNLRRVGS